ncbi:MAG TPA: class I SAM-dependent methyltransferase [Candidatus Limnocylindrales bacterium]|nr:class I SAM-dependent methyltransferase [Candidatus Limnocylindrales bacterium]
MTCQICAGPTVPGLDLGHQPVSDLLLTRADLGRPETHYPLQLHHCPGCGLTQLGYTVSPRVVYRHFPFVSGTTATATRHLHGLARELTERARLGRGSFALDIGSNDGTLLKGYQPSGVRVLGVDPAGAPVRIAERAGIETLHAFFDADTAEHIAVTHGEADVISAAGVFAHVAELDGLMRGVKRLLAPGGIFATDSQYWLDMVERLHWDNIFHQHLRYYSMRPLLRLFDRYDMEVFDVTRSDVYGGSIRAFAGHRGAHPVAEGVAALGAFEEGQGLYAAATHQEFARKVAERLRGLVQAVHALAADGRKVIGLGGPAKASTVCNAGRLGPELIAYITEVNPLRVGTYLPGVHVPIVAEDTMFSDPRPADAGILFAWNYADEIVPKLRTRGFQGEVLRP